MGGTASAPLPWALPAPERGAGSDGCGTGGAEVCGQHVITLNLIKNLRDRGIMPAIYLLTSNYRNPDAAESAQLRNRR